MMRSLQGFIKLIPLQVQFFVFLKYSDPYFRLSAFAFYSNLTSMGADDVFDDRQTKSCSLSFCPHRVSTTGDSFGYQTYLLTETFAINNNLITRNEVGNNELSDLV